MPPSFRWVQPRRLAGSGRPGLLVPFEQDLACYQAEGLRLVVTLTEQPLPALPATFGLRNLHFPIPDMGIPTPREAVRVCDEILRGIEAGEPAVVHCHAGLGRTGTMLAACLVRLGRTGDEALREVRLVNAGYVQSLAQERFLGHLELHLRQEGART